MLLDLVPAAGHQPDLFAPDNHRRQKLSPLIDRINDRYAIGFGMFPPDVRRSRATPRFTGCRRGGSFDFESNILCLAKLAVAIYLTGMSKPGRNIPCPCGSGRKFKHCCGIPGASARSPHGPTPDLLARLQLETQRHEAKEYRCRLMQGLGRPIISFEAQGYRLVAVGNEIRWSTTWVTFVDFLFDYIKAMLTPAWGQAELAKPEAEQHPLLRMDAAHQ